MCSLFEASTPTKLSSQLTAATVGADIGINTTYLKQTVGANIWQKTFVTKHNLPTYASLAWDCRQTPSQQTFVDILYWPTVHLAELTQHSTRDNNVTMTLMRDRPAAFPWQRATVWALIDTLVVAVHAPTEDVCLFQGTSDFYFWFVLSDT